MRLPIVIYGEQILRTKCSDIDKDYPDLSDLIKNMTETMFASNGIGLAAPQIDLPIRLFIIGSNQIKIPVQVFINPEIINYSEETCDMVEGCLSIPGLNGAVTRPETITIRYKNVNFEDVTETYNGLYARVIQHEYDHIEGKLYVDYITQTDEIISHLEKLSKHEHNN